LAEQKLAVQVASLNRVPIGYCYEANTTTIAAAFRYLQ
jgi:hypothetical protein